MKKIITILSFAMGLTSLVGCSDYLDSDYLFDERMTIEDVFSNRDYTNRWLARGYAYLSNGYLQDVCSKRDYPFNFADDMYYGDGGYDKWKSGHYSESGVNNSSSGIWKNAYLGIRQVAIFLNNIDKNKEFTEEEIIDFKGQAHFLRAYYYWLMLRAFGPIPIIPDEGVDYTKEYDELAYPRNSYDECVEYITGELLKAAGQLPLQRSVQEVLRPTRGAALALRAKILLYAASPLFNGKAPEVVSSALVNKDGKRLLPETYDESKWAKAAAAAKDVIELAKTSGLYELYTIAPKIGTLDMYRPPVHPEYSTKDYPDGWANIDPLLSYKSNFDGSVQGSKNPELIFTRTSDGTGTINDWMYQALPRTISGNNRLCVTQKQVNAYAMNDGRTISEAANTGDYVTTGFTTEAYSENNPFLPAKVSLMYNKREPRFYASIAYNGSVWEAASASEPRYRNQQIFYYRGTEDGKQGFKEECPLTGMTLKKFYNSEDSRTDGGYVIEKTEMTIRYAEILLIYAEALNELSEGEVYHLKTYSNEDVEIKRDEDEMRYAIKRIRMRAGVPDYTNETYKNQADFRVKLKRERQVELLGENSMRYFDLRRWKDALTEENQLLQGCNINISDDDTYIADFYKETPVSSVHKVFEQRMYLFPFPTYELKRNVNLTQNPGW